MNFDMNFEIRIEKTTIHHSSEGGHPHPETIIQNTLNCWKTYFPLIFILPLHKIHCVVECLASRL